MNIMKKSDQNQCITASVVAAAAPVRNDLVKEKPPLYLMLIADCWEHIFDYLSLIDILRMGKTCRRMNRMAGYYMREYYPELEFEWHEGRIETRYITEYVCLQTDFYPYIGRLQILWEKSNALELLSSFNTFSALKVIDIDCKKLCESQHESISNISNVLKNVEKINLTGYEIVGIFEKIANFCPKLKRMKVNCGMEDHGRFFSQYFPTLEYLRYSATKYPRINELELFLEKHSKLRTFHTDFDFFWANRDVLSQTNIQLDLLIVRFVKFSRTIPLDEFIEFSKTLYDRKFYKMLQLTFIQHIGRDIDHERMSHAITLLPQLKKMVLNSDPNLDLSRFTNLKELRIYKFDSDTNIELLAKSLPKLEQLVVWRASIETILPFIRHTKNLKTVKMWYQNLPFYYYFNLSTLNDERKKLENACQVSIYTGDEYYLRPKWKSHNFNLELDLVKIMRLDSLDLDY